MNILSLFDGISCGQVAAQRAGLKVDNYFASEIDKDAISITQKHFPNTVQLGDVTKINLSALPPIDLLIGGSPCQGFSSQCTAQGQCLNFNDPRSALFFEFVKIRDALKPKYFLLENVKMKKAWRDVITQYMGVDPILINSALVSAQNRLRYYWTNIPGIAQPVDKNIMLLSVLDGTDYSRPVYTGPFLSRRPGSIYREKYNTITTCPNLHYVHDNSGFERKLSPVEFERLQTLPDNYTEGLTRAKRHKAVGNGWTVDVIAHIFSFIERLETLNAPENKG